MSKMLPRHFTVFATIAVALGGCVPDLGSMCIASRADIGIARTPIFSLESGRYDGPRGLFFTISRRDDQYIIYSQADQSTPIIFRVFELERFKPKILQLSFEQHSMEFMYCLVDSIGGQITILSPRPPQSMTLWLDMGPGKQIVVRDPVYTVPILTALLSLNAPMDVVATFRHRPGIELQEAIPAQIDVLLKEIASEARDPAVAATAAVTAGNALAFANAGNAASALAALTSLQATLSELRTVFEVRVVSRSGLSSGLTRVPDNNPGAERAYLIVEAIDRTGAALPRIIASEEDQTTRTVTMWGVRVPIEQFEKVAADKRDDGIIQNALVGTKDRGNLGITWIMPVTGGFLNQGLQE